MLGKVDPATLPEVVTKQITSDEGEEKKIDLGEIIGLPDFDVCS
jgi:L-lactate dehydrogenase (cytochrome)